MIRTIALIAFLSFSPSHVFADEAANSPQVMTRLFAAYAKFKMADYSGAREIWEKIGAAGQGEALFNLAILYEDGLGVKPSMEHALMLYRKAGTAGSRSAQYRLGQLLLDEKNPFRNEAEATHWLERAAEQGDEDAATLLANQEGNIAVVPTRPAEQAFNRGDYAKAASLWRKRTNDGDANAQSRLAWLYEAGLGVERDLQQAVSLFKLSAEAGSPEAQYALAVMLRTGSGTELDPTQSLIWLKKAAAQGHASAISALEEFANY
ncbi:MAG: sel1 repeat family protein [Rhodospirillaceae bacterium]|nr:sel1 repeat family protein [Rhodospirillaceae bacterium]MBL6930325.1 sel1 repeat family protein [Rhodospirillales bacterium]